MSSIKDIVKRALIYIIRGVPKNYTNANICYLAPANTLKGKKVLVTGGGKGIGLAISKKIVAEGGEVVITGRDENILKQTSEVLGCKYIVMDVRDIERFDDVLSYANEVLGGLNCLVNNAGVSLHEDNFTKVTTKSFDIQIETNLKAPFFLTQKFVEYLRHNQIRGNILFVSSETGATVDDRPYGWTKSAINSMVKGVSVRAIKDDIRINAIAPGITATPMTGYDSNGNLYLEASPIKRVYLPGEVAEIAAFLISDISKCISGQIIYCNNGRTINTRW